MTMLPGLHPHRRILPILLSLTLASVAPAAAELPSKRATFQQVSTPHFRVVGDVAPRKLIEIADRLETFRAALVLLKPQVRADPSVPTIVLAFPGERAIRPYLFLDGQPSRGFSGVFAPSRWGNYLVFDALAGEDPLQSIYSGYMHFFLNENYPRAALWLRRGLGEYYETFRVGGKGIEVGRPKGEHVRFLSQGWVHPLEHLVAVTRESREYLDPDRLGIYTAHCWALVHYLMVGGEGLAPRVPDLLTRLDRGEPLAAALPAALGLTVAELEARLREYTRRPLFQFRIFAAADLDAPEAAAPVSMSRAEALIELGEYLAHVGASEPAREHLDAALALEPGNGDALALLAFLRAGSGDTDGARELYDRALAAGVGRGNSALHAAQFAWEGRGAATEGTGGGNGPRANALAAAQRAVELEPESGEAWRMVGQIALAEERGAEALVALTHAQRLLPGRSDVVHARFRAALAAGQPVVARGIASGPMASLDPALAAESLRYLDEKEAHEVDGRLAAEIDQAVAEERWAEAIERLRAAVAEARSPEMRAQFAARLESLESWRAAQERIDGYNRASAHARAGRLTAARGELDPVLAACPAQDEDEVCGLARELDRWLREAARRR